MKSINEKLWQTGAETCGDLPENKSVDLEMIDFLKSLGKKDRRRLEKILEKESEALGKREVEIYIKGFRDGVSFEGVLRAGTVL